MASTAHGASSSTNAQPAMQLEMETTNQQAGPLPRKRGEIGFREGMDVLPSTSDDTSTSALPTRHPADTDTDTDQSASNSNSLSAPPLSDAPAPSPTDTEASSTRKSSTRSGFLLSFLRRQKAGGVALTTLLRLLSQVLLLMGTIVAWVLVARKMSGSTQSESESDGNTGGRGDGGALGLGGSSSVFVHVSFGILSLAQLLFLERCIFLVRAQRYTYTHASSSLPSHHHSSSRGGGPSSAMGVAMAFAPWNRPPLPTYAAALAASGVGTGDVEDNIIAIPPPPAYGNTRGSTLLLAGFLRASLRASANPDTSEHAEEGRTSRRSRMSAASRSERPISYRSTDEEWEQRCDAKRALHLADTLERLEAQPQPRPPPRSESIPSAAGIGRAS